MTDEKTAQSIKAFNEIVRLAKIDVLEELKAKAIQHSPNDTYYLIVNKIKELKAASDNAQGH